MSESKPAAFFHELQCRSGLGDRLLDLWAAGTVARLHHHEAELDVLWHEGRQFASFLGTYSTSWFAVDRCRFVDRPPRGAMRMPDAFSHTAFNPLGIRQLPDGTRQIILRTGMIWGNTCPEGIWRDLDFYGLDGDISLDRVIEVYRETARDTTPAHAIAAAIPRDIGGRIGVHVRLGDKLVTRESSTDMTLATWRAIESDAVAYLLHCIDCGKPLYVGSDDPSYQAALVEHLRSRGADVVTSDPSRACPDRPSPRALVDFFALSRCRHIVQMSKYSTFSLAAALSGGVPLVNFYRDASGAGLRLDIWRSVLPAARARDVDGPAWWEPALDVGGDGR